MYKISNWNVERPGYNTTKTNLAIGKIKQLDSDIIVLTETSNAINLEETHPYSLSTLSYERTPNEQWVTIWSKWKIIEQLETIDAYRTVCGKIETPFGKIIVYGNIIPYHMAGVSGVRYGNLNYKTWEYHEKDLISQGENWKKILSENENIPLFIIGDFNQSRWNKKGYGTEKVRSLLTSILDDLNLTCITEIDFSKEYLTEDPKKGKVRDNIDHICVSNNFLNTLSNKKVGAWNHFTSEGKYMSDHNGVYIEFEI